MVDVVKWERWEETIRRHGIAIDRSRGSAHPRFPDLIYPVDYGYIPGTTGGDGHEVDVFVSNSETGLVGMLVTHDALKDDDEIKLLWNLTDEEIQVIMDFLFVGDMTGHLVRRPITGSR